ncbi:hypothetical protein SAMN05421770_103162 [Granulicella rosea]|uniref:Uncharacterized protein n=1 Tax=Granulicella rosea TaxID=474952 RepID=A0A239IKX0_9BACT|nr:hypothetical protein SAMN05421770_103162 [Granulicella rosea]
MSVPAKKSALSLDVWAVILSLALAVLVKAGVIHSVSW